MLANASAQSDIVARLKNRKTGANFALIDFSINSLVVYAYADRSIQYRQLNKLKIVFPVRQSIFTAQAFFFTHLVSHS